MDKTKLYMQEKDINLENLINSLPGYVYWKNKKGIYIGCNELFAQDLGFSSTKDIIGKTDYDLSLKNKMEKIRENDQKVIKLGTAIIVEEGNYWSRKIPLRNKTGEIIGILSISLNLAKFRFEKEDERDILEKIVAMMPGHVYWKNRDCILLGCNNQQAKDSGFNSRYDVVGKTAYDLLWQNQPEEDKRAQAAITNSIDEEVMSTNQSKTIEEFVILPDKTAATYLSLKAPIHDKNNNVVGLVGISIDITSKKDLEKQLYSANLVSASIAHELRTPLMTISNCTKLIEMDLDKNPLLIHEHLQNIKNEINKANEIINIMLTNVKQHEIKNFQSFKNYHINQCIFSAIERFPYSDLEDKSLIEYNTSNDFIFRGDHTLMVHVLFNLIKNSIHFIYEAGKGKIIIHLSKDSTSNYLHFKDTASGIPQKNLEMIFDKFYTTTKIGSGVGLSFCKMAIELFGGSIKCSSVEGEYTEFIIKLPQIENRDDV